MRVIGESRTVLFQLAVLGLDRGGRGPALRQESFRDSNDGASDRWLYRFPLLGKNEESSHSLSKPGDICYKLCKKLSPAESLNPKFSAIVWPISDSERRVPRFAERADFP